MKVLRLGLGVVALAGIVVACGDDGFSDIVDSINSFDVDVTEDATIPGVSPIPLPGCDDLLELPFLAPAITINLREEEELEGEEFARFDEVVLEKITIDIINVPSGDSDDFDFVDAIRVFADDLSNLDPEVLVAELDPVPRGVTSIVIPGTGVNLEDLITADEFTVRLEAAGRVPCDSVNIRVTLDFEVEVF